MKIFFILLLLSTLLSSLYLTFYFESEGFWVEENKKLHIALNVILPLASLLSIGLFIVTSFYIHFLLAFSFLLVVLIVSFCLIDSSFIILLSTIFAILIFSIWPTSKFNTNDNITTETKQEITLYNCSNDENYDSVFINISNDDDSEKSLYTIMEYNKDDVKDFELSSTLNKIDSFKITKDGENKLIITKKTGSINSFLAYLGWLKPYSTSKTTYSLYINEDNVKCSNEI